MGMLGSFGINIPSTPAEFVARTLDQPTLIAPAGGLAATIFKNITKTTTKAAGGSFLKAALAGGAAGLGAALLLGGGGSQEVKPTQTTVTTPRQGQTRTEQIQESRQRMNDLSAAFRTAQVSKQAVDQTSSSDTTTTYDATGGGDVDIGGTTNIHTSNVETITHQGIDQAVIGQLTSLTESALQQPIQITNVIPTQETTATKTDSSMIILIAVAALAAIMFLKPKKGK